MRHRRRTGRQSQPVCIRLLGITARDVLMQETWNFNYGQPYTEETEAEILNSLDSNFIQGFTLLGGEPFEPENQVELVKLLKKVRETYPKKDIWCYSGYLLTGI